VEACWSNKRIGPIGLGVATDHADIKFACSQDAYSYVDDNGERVARSEDVEYGPDEWDGGYDEYGYKTYKPIPVKDWVDRVIANVDRNASKRSQRYAEFSAVAEADCVWYKETYGRRWYLIAKRVAHELGVPVLKFD
jgi:hypothetical protein